MIDRLKVANEKATINRLVDSANTALYEGDGRCILRFEDGKEAVVEPKHLFVLGDNSPHSYDSRFWGQVPQEAVIGKAFFIMHPFTWRWGWSRKANPNVGANREDFVFD